MGRLVDRIIGIILVGFGSVVAAVGIAARSVPYIVTGLVVAAALVPAGYKLLRYPATRTVSVGKLVGDIRQQDLGLSQRGLLVCFSGIDGSGKTTQAEYLTDSLSSIGVPATSIWARWRPFISYPLMGVLYVTLGWRRKDYHKSDLLRAVWGYFVIADQLIFYFRYLFPRLIRGEVVCVDRYLLDQLVELEYDGLYNDRAVGLLERLLRKPDITFLMDVGVDQALERKDDTGEMLDRLGIDQSVPEYLTERRELYHTVSERTPTRTVMVDTEQSLEETHEEIREEVFEAYFRYNR